MEEKSTDKLKVPRLIARIISAIITGFFLLIYFGESLESNHSGCNEPMSMSAIIQLTIMGVGLVGLVVAWKWELAGGLLSLLAFVVLFFVNTRAFVIPMLIFPMVAILYIVIGYLRQKRQ